MKCRCEIGHPPQQRSKDHGSISPSFHIRSLHRLLVLFIFNDADAVCRMMNDIGRLPVCRPHGRLKEQNARHENKNLVAKVMSSRDSPRAHLHTRDCGFDTDRGVSQSVVSQRILKRLK
jgi:hypothetical protein